MEGNQENWHVFIISDMKNNGYYRSFSAHGEIGYNNFLEFVKSHEWEIVAYEGNLTEEEMDKITGFRIKPEAKNKGYVDIEKDIEKIGETHLSNLVERLNFQLLEDHQEGFELDPYKELEKLREACK